jgi:hypothetical protein
MAAEGNQSATKHGAEGAIRRISQGQPLIGMAKDMQNEVEETLETQGIDAIVRDGAIGLETAARLYKNAFLAAVEKGDLEAVDRYGARYGWIQSKALLAWGQVRKDAKEKGGMLGKVLEAYRSDMDATQDAQNTPQEGQGGQE